MLRVCSLLIVIRVLFDHFSMLNGSVVDVNLVIMQAKCQALIQMEPDCPVNFHTLCNRTAYYCQNKNVNRTKCCNSFCDCLKDIDTTLNYRHLAKNNNSKDLKLICRSDNQLLISLPAKNKSNAVFVGALYDYNDQIPQNTDIIENSAIYDDLMSNRSYDLQVLEIDEHGVRSSYSNVFRTLAIDIQLKPVLSLGVEKFIPDEKNVHALVHWSPSSDKTCNYEIVWWDVDSIHTKEIEVTTEPFKYTLFDLNLGSTYNVEISSKDGQWYRESEKIGISFTTPTCFELYGNELCKPPDQLKLNVHEVYLGNGQFDVFVDWLPMTRKPNIYKFTLKGAIVDQNHENISLSFPPDAKTMLFHKIELSHIFSVRGEAIYEDETIWDIVTREISITDSSKPETVLSRWSTLYTLIIILVISALAAWLIVHQLIKKQIFFKTSIFRKDFQNVPGGFYEVDMDQLVLYEKLGQGQFGIVRRAKLISNDKQPPKIVAVKMLINNLCKEDIRKFWEEIDVMRKVGSHPNIISIIGCSSIRSKTTFFISEYCSKGDLQNYLRDTWKKMISKNTQSAKAISSNQYEPVCTNLYTNAWKRDYMEPIYSQNDVAENLNYDMEYYASQFKITTFDLLTYAKDIASGMEYLSAKSVVHRDLAARNILVCADNTLKIADFGLSKDIYLDNIYKKIGSGKLPVKWMAPESLKRQIYTTSSDVWSYGVLLWEIMTMGATPYPSVQTSDLIDVLSSGYRMERPNKCSIELYCVMLACWNFKPNQRPVFSILKSVLNEMISRYDNYNLDTE